MQKTDEEREPTSFVINLMRIEVKITGTDPVDRGQKSCMQDFYAYPQKWVVERRLLIADRSKDLRAVKDYLRIRFFPEKSDHHAKKKSITSLRHLHEKERIFSSQDLHAYRHRPKEILV